MDMRKGKIILLFIVLPLLLSACTMPWKKKPVADTSFPDVTVPAGQAAPEASSAEPITSQVKKFADYQELEAWLEEHSSSGAIRNLAYDGMKTAVPEAGVQHGGGEGDFSTTNNQVAGVDEADIIKTDGEHIYALVRNELLIIKAAPVGEAKIMSRISFKARPQDIFVNGGFLAVFGADDQISALPAYSSFRRYNPYSFFKVFDVSNPAAPQEVRDLDFEGSYKTARLIGDYVYFVTETYGSYSPSEPLVPRLLDKGQVVSSDCSGTAKCFAPNVYYFDIPYNSYSFTSVTAINVKDASEPASGDIYLLDSSQNLYVSEHNIYITYTQYLNEYELEGQIKRELLYPRLSEGERRRIDDIEAAPSHVLGAAEKEVKVGQIIDRYLASLDDNAAKSVAEEIDAALAAKLQEKAAEMEKTVVHKIAITGNRLQYQAMGEVPGQLLNQFSMDEHGDYFRLATTRSQQWSRLSDTSSASYNNLYVLGPDMKIVGRLENLATTERIYSVRFLGDRAYIVTFRQTDPLFAISLADPTKPAVLGALKVPGYSNYLHPADASGNKLIGFGRDTEETVGGGVKTKGLKLSLYDFTDTTKPKELASYIIGDGTSDSIALSDHRAFLYSDSRDLLVVPAVLRDNGQLSFSGSLVFSVSDSGLELKGRIDHSAGGKQSASDFWDGYSYYDNTAKRSLYIGDNLYTFSNNFLKINSLNGLNEVKSLRLTSGGDDYIITPSQPEAPTEPEKPTEGPATTTPPVEDSGAATSTLPTEVPAEAGSEATSTPDAATSSQEETSTTPEEI